MSIRLKLEAANVLAASLGWLTRAPDRLRILTFHDVGDDAGDVYAVSPSRFEDYLSLLQNEGYVTIRSSELRTRWPEILERERVLLLTFDDGYAAQRDVVADALARRGLTAAFFVISSLLGATRTRQAFDGKERDFLSGDDLRQLELGGFEIGSHSHTHPLCATLPEKDVEREFVISKRIIEQEVGHAITSFAYPYGRRGAFSPMTRAALQRSGYATAFTLEGQRVTPSTDLLRLPRINVDRCDNVATFRRKLRGDYELLANMRRYGDSRAFRSRHA